MRLGLLLLVGALGGCAVQPPRPASLPPLRLDPRELTTGAWQQHLQFRQGDQVRSFEALLEVDAGQLRLVALAAQREAFRLSWDGKTLCAAQADWLPAGFQAQWVLDDLQLSLWPAASIQARLPSGWSLREDAEGRELRYGGSVEVRIRPHAGGRLIEHPRARFSLHVRSIEAASP